MTKYGSDDVIVYIDGGTLTSPGTVYDISGDVLEISTVDLEAIAEEGHGFGDSWVKNLATGLKKVADITLKGFYDDTSQTGTHALLNRAGTSTEIKIVWGGSKTTTIPVLIKNYRRGPSRGELTKFEALLATAGEPEEDAA